MNLTEGQKRVRANFNPSALKRVEDFKTIMAASIDSIQKLEDDVKATPATMGHDTMRDFLRECATAKTELQKASMMGVAALTHDQAFKCLPHITIENE